eukprot:scaffold1661_cov251-Pinguiococcus_pyrenoidosus.AAC.29
MPRGRHPTIGPEAEAVADVHDKRAAPAPDGQPLILVWRTYLQPPCSLLRAFLDLQHQRKQTHIGVGSEPRLSLLHFIWQLAQRRIVICRHDRGRPAGRRLTERINQDVVLEVKGTFERSQEAPSYSLEVTIERLKGLSERPIRVRGPHVGSQMLVFQVACSRLDRLQTVGSGIWRSHSELLDQIIRSSFSHQDCKALARHTNVAAGHVGSAGAGVFLARCKEGPGLADSAIDHTIGDAVAIYDEEPFLSAFFSKLLRRASLHKRRHLKHAQVRRRTCRRRRKTSGGVPPSARAKLRHE